MHTPATGIYRDSSPLLFDWLNAHWNQSRKNYLFYHNYSFCHKLSKYINEIAEETGLPQEQADECTLASTFFLAGMLEDYLYPEPPAKQLAVNFMEANGFGSEAASTISSLVDNIRSAKSRGSALADIINDAFNACYFGEDFPEEKPVLRMELEFNLKKNYTNADWEQLQLQRLLNAAFKTSYARLKFESILSRNILYQKNCMESANIEMIPEEEKDATVRFFQDLGKKGRKEGIQTYISNAYMTKFNAARNATSKARTLIALNTLLLCIVPVVTSLHPFLRDHAASLSPVLAILFFFLSSLVFAVISALPSVQNRNEDAVDLHTAKKNIFFFGNYTQLTPLQFQESLDTVFRDEELLYGNMARDMYHFGKTLKFKLKQLTLSFYFFLAAMISMVLFFAALYML